MLDIAIDMLVVELTVAAKPESRVAGAQPLSTAAAIRELTVDICTSGAAVIRPCQMIPAVGFELAIAAHVAAIAIEPQKRFAIDGIGVVNETVIAGVLYEYAPLRTQISEVDPYLGGEAVQVEFVRVPKVDNRVGSVKDASWPESSFGPTHVGGCAVVPSPRCVGD